MRIVLALFFSALSIPTFALNLPDGWRLPSEKELSGEERDNAHNSYSSGSRFSKAEGDFNSDGVLDFAYILVSTKFNGDGLFIYLSTPYGYKWIALEEGNLDKAYPDKGYVYSTPAMGIGALSPTTFRSYVENAWPENNVFPEEADFSSSALDYFKFESAGSLYFWSKSNKKFVRFWYSD
ncbi:hypothetical protein [Microbulbifer sp. SAOS-129_SWC]|uniref:hypothetical protein n=1 Tax=Microbulbifer sp. SAOS-129_SWC TaxID=3145235 RepID=UPI0032164CFE